MRKKYVISGAVEFSLQAGGYLIRFENGAISGLCTVPASYVTEKKEVQDIIENTAMFKNGRIKIAEVYGEPEEPVATKVNMVAEVTTMQEARKYLMEQGVPMEALQNKAAVLEQAKVLDITFPNWK